MYLFFWGNVVPVVEYVPFRSLYHTMWPIRIRSFLSGFASFFTRVRSLLCLKQVQPYIIFLHKNSCYEKKTKKASAVLFNFSFGFENNILFPTSFAHHSLRAFSVRFTAFIFLAILLLRLCVVLFSFYVTSCPQPLFSFPVFTTAQRTDIVREILTVHLPYSNTQRND